MKDDDVERRAKALADVILELLPIKDAKYLTDVKQPELVKARNIAEGEAHWLVESLEDPAGELGVWNVKKQMAQLDKALSGLRKVEEAFSELASPVKLAVSRSTKINRGLVIPPQAANVLAARKMRLEQLPGNALAIPEEADPSGYEADLIEDAADPLKEITIRIGTVPQTAPVLIQEIRKALQQTKAKVRDVIALGQSPGHRLWPAIRAYQQLEGLWENYQGDAPPRFPKDSDPFYEFAERAFEALEIRGVGSSQYASIRSTFVSLREWEHEQCFPDSELDKK